jgi:DNA primase
MSDPVLSLLQKENLSYTVSGRDYLIKCLNPKHEDSNPSLRVDKVSGIAHCFACGFKRNLFKHFGIFTSNTPVRIAKLKEKLNNLTISNMEIPYPDGALPYTAPYRNISIVTLKYFGAFYTHEDPIYEGRILFPIKNIDDKVIAFQGRSLNDNVSPKYKFFPSGVSLPCYPSTFKDKPTSVVLVEGIIDMINLVDKGLSNVSCVFGTQSLNHNTTAKLLPFKALGVNKLFILFDGDTPGREAAISLKSVLEDQGFTTEIIQMEDDTDPGMLSKEQVKALKDYIDVN